jgi:uncharacterized repeat protein (TIGR01451 family)
MHKPKKVQLSLTIPSARAVLAGLLLTLAALPQAKAQTPPGCIDGFMAPGINVTGPVLVNKAHVGDVITITALGVSLAGSGCDVTNGTSYIMYPNGNTAFVAGPPTGTGLNGIQTYETNFTLIHGTVYNCLSAPPASATCSPVTLTYVVDAADENKALSFTTQRGFTSGFVPGSPKTIKFLCVSDGILANSDGSLTVGGQANASVSILSPCIGVTKNCALPQGQTCFPAGQPIAFSGTVTNCGDTTLFGITLTDNPTASITIASTTSSGRAYDGSLTNGESVNYTGSYLPVGSPACTNLSDTVTAVGFDAIGIISGAGVTNTATVSCPVCCTPIICVTKGVACAPATGAAGCDGTVTYGPTATGVAGPTNRTAFCYQIVVSNCGSDNLTNVTVVDNLVPGVDNFPTTLAVGQSVTNYYSSSYPAPSTNVNTVTATGTGVGSGIVTNAHASAVAIVRPIGVVCGSPSLSTTQIPSGSVDVPVTFSEVISNSGQADLSVTITGLPPLVSCADTNVAITIPNPFLLAAGASTNIQGCLLVSCPGVNVSLSVKCTAVASTSIPCVYDANGNAITTASSGPCTASVKCLPKICVTKGITCAPVGGIAACDSTLTYAPSATGIAGPTNRTAFCYQVVVSNCGQEDLANVTVSDSLLSSVAGSFPSTLAAGQSVTNYYGQSYGLGSNNRPSTNVNTVIANGTGVSSAIVVHATNSAVAVVLPISVACQSVTLHSDFDQDAFNGGADGSLDDNHVTLPGGSVSTPVTFIEVITNTGVADLNVTVSGLPPLVDCNDTNTAITIQQPLFIPAGGSATITGCLLASCPGVNINVTAQGTAVANQTIPCVFDANGNAVATGVSQACPASVSCVAAVTCRVTGGGVLMPGASDQSCILVNTTILPLIVNGLPVDKITHGGQLGAPFSQMDCGAILGNPCIRGQWEHVRHYVGKGNPRDVIDMNFHSTTPKGQFDSLSCACLGCCDPATGVFIPPVVGPLIHKFALCNPDDHSICGPEPRPAPANSIIFSGVGTLTPTTDSGANNKAATWVVFRVYIEDRSEPGGLHPNGAINPSDIYCFQAWNTGILVSKKPDFNKIQTQFRRDLGAANCAFVDALSNGDLPIGSLPSPIVDGITADVQDCGPLYSGNHQIHPATDATCP